MKNIKVLVSSQDEAYCDQFKWFITGRGYAYRSEWNPTTKKNVTKLLHRDLLNITNSLQFVDHINGNKLDNRRENLRVVTPRQNKFNTRYRGCYYCKKSSKYVAQIRINGVKTHLGSFVEEKSALQAYRTAAQAYHKEYAFNYSQGE